jgi:hypothetical protein
MSRSNGHGVTKLSRSVHLDKPVVEEANAKNINLSALANDLPGECFRTDSSARARLEAKREHLLERGEHHQGQLDRIED